MAQTSTTYIEDKPLTPTPVLPSNNIGRKPRILVVNDDGVKSSGLKQLALALEDIGDVVVVSTIDNQIHPSFSITIDETIRAKKLEIWGKNILVYAVSGFPMNCLKFAYGHVIPNVLQWDELDIVIAGINKGRNVGTDLLYSGTMSLACAARFGNESFMQNNKTPKAISISLCPPALKSTSSLSSAQFLDWNFAISVKAALQITKLALQSYQTNNVVWNVNIPPNPKQSDDDIFYWAVTKPATLKYDPDALIHITKDEEKLNFTDFVINPPNIYSKQCDNGSDLFALKNGIISISPIELSPALHTPLHATNNLIDFIRNDREFCSDMSNCWEISVDIRPLQCIVRCLEHWLKLKDKNGTNGNDNILLQTYTLYLERDIKICGERNEFGVILSNSFGWSETQQKFTNTLNWSELKDLYDILRDIEGHKWSLSENRSYNMWNMALKAVVITAASMAVIATASFVMKRSKKEAK